MAKSRAQQLVDTQAKLAKLVKQCPPNVTKRAVLRALKARIGGHAMKRASTGTSRQWRNCRKYRTAQRDAQVLRGEPLLRLWIPTIHTPVVGATNQLLDCPKCCTRHVDTGTSADIPHVVHTCLHCRHSWQPFDYPTVGVAIR